jgi:hypothetical protein
MHDDIRFCPFQNGSCILLNGYSQLAAEVGDVSQVLADIQEINGPHDPDTGLAGCKPHNARAYGTDSELHDLDDFLGYNVSLLHPFAGPENRHQCFLQVFFNRLGFFVWNSCRSSGGGVGVRAEVLSVFFSMSESALMQDIFYNLYDVKSLVSAARATIRPPIRQNRYLFFLKDGATKQNRKRSRSFFPGLAHPIAGKIPSRLYSGAAAQ